MIQLLRLPGLDEVPLAEGVAILEEYARYVARPVTSPRPERLLLGDRELPWSDGDCGWPFETGFEAGHLALRATTEADPLLRLRVLPNAEKIGEAQWLRIIEDVERWLPAGSVGLEGASRGRVGSNGSPAPLLASALGPLVAPLARALRSLLQDPHELPVAAEREVRAHAVRAARSSTLRWLVHRPEAWAAIGHQGATGNVLEPLVPVRWSEMTRDHPAHRYLVWLLERAGQVTSALADRLQRAGDEQKLGTSAEWCRARARQLVRAHSIVDDARRRTWLKEVRAAPISDAALLAMVDDPAYARVHSLLRRFIRPLFALAGDDGIQAPVRATFDMYELWCFLALHRALKDRLPDARWFRKGVSAGRFSAGRGHGARFAAELQRGRLEIHFNPTFPSYLVHGESPRFSISGERRPDTVVTWQPAAGAASWMCLDAKYRVREEHLAEAFVSAHIYRDALRWRDRGGRCEGVLLLVPNMLARCAPWFGDAFYADNRVGASCFSPGESGLTVADRVLRTLGVGGETERS